MAKTKTKQQIAKEKIRKDKLETSQRKAKKKARESEWYGIRSLLGYVWAIFYVLLGAREAG